MDLLSQHVADEAFLNLIRMFMTNTLMGSDGTIYTNTDIGISQGSVLYPILWKYSCAFLPLTLKKRRLEILLEEVGQLEGAFIFTNPSRSKA